MDLSSPIAMIIAYALVVGGIIFLGGSVMDFANLPSVVLVIGPTLAAMVMSFPFSDVMKIPKHMKIILGGNKFDPLHYVNIMSDLAEKARAQGLLALEAEAENMDDAFVKSAVMMVADATDPETVETRLVGVIDALTMRHSIAWAIYEKGAAYAPAFGMCATVVSLVNMLQNLDFADAGGVASLGINMSAALITTLYGSLMANTMFVPTSNKLRGMHQSEVDCKNIVIEGVLAIQRGINPRVVKEMLLERLDPTIASAAAGE